MKKFLGVFVLILVLFVAIFSLNSCKETYDEYNAIVSVKLLSDTTIAVPYAYVRIEKYDIRVEGTTDENGEFKHTFNQEMILDVIAVVDSFVSPTGSELSGETTIRLKANKTVRQSVFVN